MKKIALILLGVLSVFHAAGFAASTDEWIGKATNAAANLANGNPEGAAQQMAPNYYIPLSKQSRVGAGLGSVDFNQQIPGVNQLSSKAFGVTGNYNAGMNYGFNHVSAPSQNVQVNAGNQYLSNATTFSPSLWRDQRDH